MPTTFSYSANGASDSSQIRSASITSTERMPSIPARVPAIEKSWQGAPKVSIVNGPTSLTMSYPLS